MMYYISFLFYPHILLLMVYVGLQRFRDLFVVFLGAVLGGNILTISLIHQIVLNYHVLPSKFSDWSDQTLLAVFLGFYSMALLGNLMVMYSLRKGPSKLVSSWNWFGISFGVGMLAYGPYALMISQIWTFPFAHTVLLNLVCFGCLGVCWGLFLLATKGLSWVGVSKEKCISRMLYGIRWVLILACSTSIWINGRSLVQYYPVLATWHTGNTKATEVIFQGDTWTFRKQYSQKPDLTEVLLQLESPSERLESQQESPLNGPTKGRDSYEIFYNRLNSKK